MKAFLLLAAAGALLPARGSIDLVSHQAVGDVFEEKESSWTSSSTAALDADGTRPSFEFGGARGDIIAALGASETHRTVLDEVLAVNDGKPTRVKRTFVVSSSTAVDSTAAGAPRLTSTAFEGQTVVLVEDDGGTRIVGELEGEEELTESDRSLSSRWELVLPGRPVAVGETWSLSEEASKRLLEGMNVAGATAWCTLGGIDDRASGSPARIKLDIRATTKGGPEGTSEIHANGEVLWSTAGSYLQEVTLSGEIRTTGSDGIETKGAFGVTREVRKIE